MADISDKYSKTGLTSSEADTLQKKYGRNVLAESRKTSALKIFAGQFRDVMVCILLAATAASFFLGEVYDAITIAVIVLLNAVLGFVQEYRTEKTLQALKNMSAPEAKVYRDGMLRNIAASELVPSDIIMLEAGDRVPADAVILEARNLLAEESILTGESVPVSKDAGSADDTDNSIGKSNILYSGTSIIKGNAKAKVIATGLSAQIGKISDMLTDINEEMTPLQKRLGELGKVVAIICIVVCGVVAGAGILRGEPVFDMIMTGISIAIAAIPEGLPATVTIALALAVRRMLKQNALVHKLHSVETLGCTSVICTDKTGTVTENKMTVTDICTHGKLYTVSGSGYRTSGSISTHNEPVKPEKENVLHELLRCAVLCNNASLTEGKEVSVTGDPTEIALIVAAAKAGVRREALEKHCKRTYEIPFDSETRCMTVIYKGSAGNVTYSKGSADVILEKCGYIMTDDGIVPIKPSHRREIMRMQDDMTGRALRVLAFSVNNPEAKSGAPKNMVYLGMTGMSDPPRAEAIKAVKLCRSAHIRTVMITGDHKNTAAAVAAKAGIFREGDMILTGSELNAMSDDELENVIDKVSVYARVSPADKLRIVKAFKKRGEIVTMTGDGVNDAPAVKEASIGVAMGITGTDVTRQAADAVLLDDNFATLVKAVEEGRGIYANIRKFVRYLLSCNIGEVLAMFIGIIAGLPTILLPTQLLLVNLATDGLPAIALGTEPSERENMTKPPRKPDESFFSGGLMIKIIFRGIMIGLCSVGCFALMLYMTGDTATARTAALFTLVMTQLAHVFECKSERKNIFTVPYLNNPRLISAALTSLIIIFAAIYVPFMQVIFSTVALTRQQLLIAFGFAMLAPLLQCFVKSKQ